MKYKRGDRVKIKSLDWYNNNRDSSGQIVSAFFDMQRVRFCGTIQTIANDGELLNTGVTVYPIEDACEYIGEEAIEGLAEETSQEDEFNKMYQEMVKEVDERFKNHKRPKVSGVCQECVFAVNDNNPHCGLRGFRNDFNVKSCSAKNNAIPNGFELQSDGYFSWINKKEYPKTYCECKDILGLWDIDDTERGYYQTELIDKLQMLLICRDAYWKIAGEEMGLGKPWSPDYDSGVNKYGIICMNGVVQESNPTTNWERHLNKVLDFPTAEMRDAFKVNFDPDIEFCKELL